MTDDSLHQTIVRLRGEGLAQAETRIGPFAVMLAAMAPQVLSGQFSEQARKAIALAKQAGVPITSADLINQIAEDVDKNGVDVKLPLGPSAISLNFKPNLVGLARGETPRLTIDAITLTETLSLDLGNILQTNAQGTAVKVTITSTTTGTRDENTNDYSVQSKSNIDLEINASLG
jgi:hypothetical protein